MIKPYSNHKPKIHSSVYVSSQAAIIGKVTILKDSSIWPGCVLRGDVDEIIINEDVNIQDGTLIHTNYDLPVVIGSGTTVGHGVVLHGCRIGKNCLVGMGAIILDGAVVEDNAIIGAGCVVVENTVVKEATLILGVPGKAVRKVTNDEIEHTKKNAKEYLKLAKMHKKSE